MSYSDSVYWYFTRMIKAYEHRGGDVSDWQLHSNNPGDGRRYKVEHPKFASPNLPAREIKVYMDAVTDMIRAYVEGKEV